MFLLARILTYAEVENSLTEASNFFDQIVERRETLIKESREVISLSSKAIIAVHSSEINEAESLKKLARERLKALRRIAGADLTKYLVTPEQEFVECSVLI